MGRIHVRLNGEPYKGRTRDLVHQVNEGYEAWGVLKCVRSNAGFGINIKKCLYEGVVIVPTVLYGAEEWGMKRSEGRKVNVLEMKFLRNFVRV